MNPQLKFYIEYYNLPILSSTESVDSDFIESIKTKHNFVIITIYDKNKQCLFLRDFNKDIGWEFPGGYIKEDEKPEAAAHRIALEEAGLRIDELQPIAIVRNIFTHGRLSIVHEGVAFTALSRDRLGPFGEQYSHIYTDHLPSKIAYQNTAVFKCYKKFIFDRNEEPPYEEIESIRKSSLARVVNLYIVKPIGALASRKIFSKISSLIVQHPKSILDASCGDSSNIVNLQKIYPHALCIGNDISWKTIAPLEKKITKAIFTNHNIINFPFKKTFDVIIFKNTLHHIPTEKQKDLISTLIINSKQLILIDINDPEKTSLISRLWNLYYRWFLRDQGHYFLNFNSFQKLVDESSPGKIITFGQIKTVKGLYMYASILSNQEDSLDLKDNLGSTSEVSQNQRVSS